MSKKPEISIIVPVYNVEPYVARCLDSLIEQTLRDIEIICVDDKSTDNSLSILYEYAKKDKRIRVIALEKNSGVSTARNTGIDAAIGGYISFVDPDDYVDINFYERLYICAIQSGCDIVKGNTETTYFNGSQWDENDQLVEVQKFGKWHLHHPWIAVMCCTDMVNRHNLRFRVDMMYGEDEVFLAECVAVANKVCVCLDVFYHYLRRENSLATPILSPEKITSELKSVNLICDIYNNSDMAPNVYLSCYYYRWHKLIRFLFHQNTSLSCRKNVMENLISLYINCKNKSGLMKIYRQEYPDYAETVKYIQSHDVENLLKFFLSYEKEHTSGSLGTPSRKTRKILLFSCLPVIKIINSPCTDTISLFGVRLFKRKHSNKNTRISILYIPILRVKQK